MKHILALTVLLLAAAQPAGVPGYNHWSAADIQKIGAKLDAAAAPNKSAGQDLAKWGNHWATLSKRVGDGEGEVHEKVNDFFIAEGGEATLIVGGKLVEPRNTGPGEIRSKGIQGGTRTVLKPGAVVHIPKNTPHQLLVPKEFLYFIIKVQE
jgi:mannose-6-phosphate isomerase-like protein (cupin superfamily)